MKSQRIAVIALSIGFGVQGFAQGTANVKGSCNGTAVGSNLTVTVKCDDGMSQKDADKLASQYAEILKRIRSEKLSFEQVNEKLDSIQKGVDDLRSHASGRHLTDQQKIGLSQLASGVPKQFMVVIGSADSSESSAYAEEIRQVFVKDGTTRALGTLFGWHPKVIVVQIHSVDEQCRPYAEAILKGMNDLGISAKGEPNPAVHEGEIHILVGEQP